MSKNLPHNLTQLANDAQRDPEAARVFLAEIYEILRNIAHKHADNCPAAGEGATEVAHEVAADFLEAYTPTTYVNRQQVLGGFVSRIRHKLIDLARGRKRSKRGGGAAPGVLDSKVQAIQKQDVVEVLAVEEAFGKLKAEHPNAYQVLKLRNQGFSVQEVADKLDVSPKTVVRWTKFGTAFLYGELSGNAQAAPIVKKE